MLHLYNRFSDFLQSPRRRSRQPLLNVAQTSGCSSKTFSNGESAKTLLTHQCVLPAPGLGFSSDTSALPGSKTWQGPYRMPTQESPEAGESGSEVKGCRTPVAFHDFGMFSMAFGSFFSPPAEVKG